MDGRVKKGVDVACRVGIMSLIVMFLHIYINKSIFVVQYWSVVLVLD